ncbi:MULTISPECIES: ATP-binding cassette domain-containing protein [unclassified Neisseria]|uniref:ATP-binding cassette domain-containing protein n=1 Tax=unclassified Neisseria TaxID=2623750 RepID=UPI00266679F6|nr:MULTISPECIES: ATP-binding cassette domain-containing protein [unclassified Neisseria]MDO1510224.1 ATP-binding cassette domain-containing protein [Neisseria sp. MVDL19-042950]MDO1516393.1 ATP-binding cassette domain-containing protein [Neisseria sp. MVDL18-041461]MDO1563541.1 ATP-binding cassette domain-containing protein [Neisseria sp. MVDL20-010259]
MKNALFVLKQVITLLSKNSRFLFYISFVLFLLVTTFRIVTPLAFALIVVEHNNIASGLLWGAIIYASLFFITRFLEELRFSFYVSFEQEVQKLLLLRTIDIFFRVPLSMPQSQSPSENAISVDRGVGGLRDVLYSFIFTLAPVGIEAFIMVVIIGFRIDLIMAIWASSILIGFIWITTKLSERTRALQEEWFSMASVNYKILSESLRSYETIRSFEQSKWVRDRYGIAMDSFVKRVIASLRPGIILGFIQGILLTILMGSTISFVLTSDLQINEKIASIILINGLLLQMVSPLLQFSGAYRVFTLGLSSARQLVELINTLPAQAKIAHIEYEGEEEFKISNLIVKHNEKIILNIDKLLIPRLKFITISGASGSGKSTLARCLAGLNEYEGRIYSKQKTDRIFFMTQEVHVFDTTVEENISMGLPVENSKFFWALVHAGISEEEYKSLESRGVGEGGINVSGGQRQRIGIARMLYHEAEVMIFDEPTSALDEVSAYKVIDTLLELSKERTCIVVTHDSRCVQVSDINFQIKNGVVVNQLNMTSG